MKALSEFPFDGDLIATMEGRVIWTNHESGDIDPLLSFAKVNNMYIVRDQIVVELENVVCWDDGPVYVRDIVFNCDAKLFDKNGEPIWEGVRNEDIPPEALDMLVSRISNEDYELVIEEGEE